MSQPRRIPAHCELLRTDTIRPDTPLRLDVAAALAYPDGSMTASGLRREHKRGRLIIERTAGKDYTTLANIERMRALCHVNQARRDSGKDPNEGTKTVDSLTLPPGLSSTAVANSALESMLTTFSERKKL
jgi:hypothetical protein